VAGGEGYPPIGGYPPVRLGGGGRGYPLITLGLDFGVPGGYPLVWLPSGSPPSDLGWPEFGERILRFRGLPSG
jgi:hypothetical protein